MATAEELLASVMEEIEEVDRTLVANFNSREIFIPAAVQVLGVESDDDVHKLYFNIPRYYCDAYFSEYHICINFENARVQGDFFPVKDVEIIDEKILAFDWRVDRTAFKYKGDVAFNICLKKYDENGVVIHELNTTPATLPVLKGLETTAAVVEENSSAFDAVLFRLYCVEAATGNGQNGYYSIAKVEEKNYGTVFTIINSDGTTNAIVKHGEDGYSPVRGVDYWTDEDSSNIWDSTISHISKWAPRTALVTLPKTGWIDNSQTVTVDGISEESIIFVAPEPSAVNYTEYTEQEVRCVSQGVNTLTFECKTTPTFDLEANVAIYFCTSDTDTIGNLVVTDDGEGNVTIM